MLFDLGTNKAIAVPDWAKAEMKKDYPEFYSGQPLKLSTLRPSKVRLVDSTDHEGGQYRNIMKAPEPTGHKAIGSVIQPDKTVLNFRYAQYAPPVQNGFLVFAYPNGTVDLRDNFVVRPDQEDLLFYLVYGCKAILGNKAGSARPFYKFERQGADSIQKIHQFNKNKKMEDFIYNKLEYNVLLNALQILNIEAISIEGDSEGTESSNRIMLYDRIRNGSEVFQQNALYLTLIGYEKKAGANVVVEEDPNTLANRLINEGKIAIGELGWYEKDKRGDGTKLKAKPFFETPTADADAARFALVDFFKANEAAYSEFKTK